MEKSPVNDNKIENNKTTQSIEQFLKENGIEHVPHIEVKFYFNDHASVEAGMDVAQQLKDRDVDIFIPEAVGWSHEELKALRQLSLGEITPEKFFSLSENKDSRSDKYFKLILGSLYNSKKEILMVDIPSDHKDLQDHYEVYREDMPEFEERLALKRYSYEEAIEEVTKIISKEVTLQKDRESYILESLKQKLFEILKERLDLQNKESLKILFAMGATHTGLYHELKKSGNDSTREFDKEGKYHFDTFSGIFRTGLFKGMGEAKKHIPKLILILLLVDHANITDISLLQKLIKESSDSQIKELFEKYDKSKSDIEFSNETHNWITKQFKNV
jgi:hypothetical protein